MAVLQFRFDDDKNCFDEMPELYLLTFFFCISLGRALQGYFQIYCHYTSRLIMCSGCGKAKQTQL